MRVRRAAARSARGPVVRAPIPGRRHDRRCQDQDEQNQNGAAHLVLESYAHDDSRQRRGRICRAMSQ
jgi:hypothetical protein